MSALSHMKDEYLNKPYYNYLNRLMTAHNLIANMFIKDYEDMMDATNKGEIDDLEELDYGTLRDDKEGDEMVKKCAYEELIKFDESINNCEFEFKKKPYNPAITIL